MMSRIQKYGDSTKRSGDFAALELVVPVSVATEKEIVRLNLTWEEIGN